MFLHSKIVVVNVLERQAGCRRSSTWVESSVLVRENFVNVVEIQLPRRHLKHRPHDIAHHFVEGPVELEVEAVVLRAGAAAAAAPFADELDASHGASGVHRARRAAAAPVADRLRVGEAVGEGREVAGALEARQTGLEAVHVETPFVPQRPVPAVERAHVPRAAPPVAVELTRGRDHGVPGQLEVAVDEPGAPRGRRHVPEQHVGGQELIQLVPEEAAAPRVVLRAVTGRTTTRPRCWNVEVDCLPTGVDFMGKRRGGSR